MRITLIFTNGDIMILGERYAGLSTLQGRLWVFHNDGARSFSGVKEVIVR